MIPIMRLRPSSTPSECEELAWKAASESCSEQQPYKGRRIPLITTTMISASTTAVKIIVPVDTGRTTSPTDISRSSTWERV